MMYVCRQEEEAYFLVTLLKLGGGHPEVRVAEKAKRWIVTCREFDELKEKRAVRATMSRFRSPGKDYDLG